MWGRAPRADVRSALEYGLTVIAEKLRMRAHFGARRQAEAAVRVEEASDPM
jgi:hypothetical protein